MGLLHWGAPYWPQHPRYILSVLITEGSLHLLDNHLPDVAVGWWVSFCHKGALLACVQLVVHQNCQVFFCKAAFHLIGHQPLLKHEVIKSHMQNFTFPFDKLDEISVMEGTNYFTILVMKIVTSQSSQGKFYKIVSSLTH